MIEAPERPSWFRFYLSAWRAPRSLSPSDRFRNCAVLVGGRVVAGIHWRAAGGDA